MTAWCEVATKVGDRVRQLRGSAGLTQQALADKMGIKREAVKRFETSDGWNPTLDTLRKLASALGTSAAELIRLAEKD
jgi:transcriptional regulator with XRE-family HTH domain